MTPRERRAIRAVVELLTAPASDVGAAALAKRLGMSRDSVYQLLLPLVRLGILEAGRGRNGGYRASPGAAREPVASLLDPGKERSASRTEPGWLRSLERAAQDAYVHVFASVTLGELAEKARETREAITWDI